MESNVSQFHQDRTDKESKETANRRATVAASLCPVRDATACGKGAAPEVPESQSAILLLSRWRRGGTLLTRGN